MNPEELARVAQARASIDDLDRRIVALLAERTGVVRKLTENKRDEAEVRSPDRVAAVLARIAGLAAEQGMPPGIAVATYRTLIAELTEMQLTRLAERRAERRAERGTTEGGTTEGSAGAGDRIGGSGERGGAGESGGEGSAGSADEVPPVSRVADSHGHTAEEHSAEHDGDEGSVASRVAGPQAGAAEAGPTGRGVSERSADERSAASADERRVADSGANPERGCAETESRIEVAAAARPRPS